MWRATQTGMQVLLWPRVASAPAEADSSHCLLVLSMSVDSGSNDLVRPMIFQGECWISLPVVTFPCSGPNQTYCLYVCFFISIIIVFTWFLLWMHLFIEKLFSLSTPSYYLRQEPSKGSPLRPPELCLLKLRGSFAPSHLLETQHAHSRPLVNFR